METTAPCEKCRSDIDVEAERCPECGYEPGSGGAATGVLTWGAMMLFVTFAGIAVIALVMAVGPADPVSGLVVAVVFGGLSLLPAAHLRNVVEASQRTPAVTDEA